MYVNNVEEFLEHTRSHVQNLKYLAKHILKRAENSDFIKDALRIPEGADISEFTHKVVTGLGYHDAAKMERESPVVIGKHLEARIAKKMTQEITDQSERIQAAKKLIKRGFSMPDVLYAGYGGNLLSMGEKAENDFFDFVNNTLNKKDGQIMEQYIDLAFEEDWEKASFKKIEEIVDKIDRGMSPISIEEFGREVIPASHFIENEEPIIKDLIIDCENNYDSICPREFYNKRVREMDEEALNKTREKISSTTGVYHITKTQRQMDDALCSEMYDLVVKEAHEIKDKVSKTEQNRHQKTLSEIYGAGRGLK
jgi:hypothetical protein